MTPLERMARAICEARGIYLTEWREFLPEARAALIAIREPDLMTTVAGAKVIVEEMKGDEDYFAAKGAWTAMIDHVLNGGEG
jgi:hypothetical protein